MMTKKTCWPLGKLHCVQVWDFYESKIFYASDTAVGLMHISQKVKEELKNKTQCNVSINGFSKWGQKF